MSSRHFHMIASFLLIIFIVFFQSYVLAQFSSPWLQPDLVTIAVVYFSIEHFLPGALFKVLLAGIFMEIMSAAPANFFLMYFTLALVISNLVSRHLVLHSHLTQFLSFAGIFALKYVFLLIVLASQQTSFETFEYIRHIFPTMLATTVCVLPGFWLLSKFDSIFEFYPVHDRHLEDL